MAMEWTKEQWEEAAWNNAERANQYYCRIQKKDKQLKKLKEQIEELQVQVQDSQTLGV